MICPSSVKNNIGSLIGIVLNLWIALGSMPGSSPGGSREFDAGTASARIRKQLLN